jgi:asparagine N-glycosylation enzyme membrane subunit Stt3
VCIDSVVLIPLAGIATMALITLVWWRNAYTVGVILILSLFTAVSIIRCASAAHDFLDCVSPTLVVILALLTLMGLVALVKSDIEESRAKSGGGARR